ncbi:MAG: dihydroneopterin aldolase [Capnocytophaga felis]|uniref:7,8-dihydroneopterin aldolase n=1 Tax=Capnocytophaga felis TaxID=2267611 RepID=A0A5M4BA07_9FLAO|nr:dihydroneopterin aldolase [Capnocytophaga felis]MDO4782930.1 dihydroneopterin aldolase [Capnocytophaga felis]GET46085.1 7,8-dihydroneopterin aldolase [Capnocytophaga felis]GET48877.1 7,8-dihydroneopterin aldolase [Capnocytophaga felis]
MGQIILKNIRIHTNHGCLNEEKLIGSDYRVDLKVKLGLEKSITSDDLSDTVNYVHLNRIVKEEMAIRSKLLEHVAGRISDRIFKELLRTEKVVVKISKLNPPIGGDVEAVSIKIKRKRFC